MAKKKWLKFTIIGIVAFVVIFGAVFGYYLYQFSSIEDKTTTATGQQDKDLPNQKIELDENEIRAEFVGTDTGTSEVLEIDEVDVQFEYSGKNFSLKEFQSPQFGFERGYILVPTQDALEQMALAIRFEVFSKETDLEKLIDKHINREVMGVSGSEKEYSRSNVTINGYKGYEIESYQKSLNPVGYEKAYFLEIKNGKLLKVSITVDGLKIEDLVQVASMVSQYSDVMDEVMGTIGEVNVK